MVWGSSQGGWVWHIYDRGWPICGRKVRARNGGTVLAPDLMVAFSQGDCLHCVAKFNNLYLKAKEKKNEPQPPACGRAGEPG